MPRFAVTWKGEVKKTVPVEVPADGLYILWSRHREEVLPGTIDLRIEEVDDFRLAHLTFRVLVRREIEATSPADAVGSFLHDGRFSQTIRLEELTVEGIADPPAPAAPG